MKSAVSSSIWIALAMAIAAVFLTQSWREPAAIPAATIDAAAGARTLEQELRNPKSFELIAATAMEPDTSCYDYRAQNGFGGMNVEHALRIGEIIVVQSDPSFPKLWNAHCAGPARGVDVTEQVRLLLSVRPST